MVTHELTWYYPTKISDAVKLISNEGVVLHAGGTRILKTKPRNLKGLVDISGLDLNYIKLEKKKVVIGAGSTFTDVVKFCRKNNLLKGLADVLADSAATPLRNRITIGGSLKDFPLWSSLYAPLMALNAKVEIAGPKKITCTVEEYVKDHHIKSKHIIKQVIVPFDEDVVCKSKKFTLIRFEYPMFVISAALKLKEKKIKEAHIVITGVTGRYHKYAKAEKVLHNEYLNEDTIAQSLKHFTPKFHADFRYSEEYKEYLAKVYFLDLMNELAGEIK